MATLLTVTERDIFCVERPDLCSIKTRDLYHDGVITMSRSLGFAVMVYVKTDGEIVYMNVRREYPDGVREELPAPKGFFDAVYAQAKELVLTIKTILIWGSVLFVIFVVWQSGILGKLAKEK